MDVIVDYQMESCPLAPEAVTAAVHAALEHGQREGLRVGIVMADDALMVELHGEYLDDPTPTDVITFDLSDEARPDAGTASGCDLPPELRDAPQAELYVGVEEARRVAAQRGVDWARELALYVVHGVLHLCGFDDHDERDAAAMRVAEHAVMERLGYPSDDAPHHM